MRLSTSIEEKEAITMPEDQKTGEAVKAAESEQDRGGEKSSHCSLQN